ncbi:hypothetical protein [Vibrio jasicida]|uniref:hypothetical protein n=1 Tax=Vibrio jasicida TaxID=766224 RepID=UPI000CE39AF4|nr:hypothetical protein [Vibrio jasicida]
MKNVLVFVTLLAASFVHAEDAITFPTEQAAGGNDAIVFPTVQNPIVLVGGYEVENGVLRSRTYDCGINISDLNLSAQLVWEGATPKVMIVGDDLIMCRSLANSPFELDISTVLNQLPNHDLYRLEIANHVNFHR